MNGKTIDAAVNAGAATVRMSNRRFQSMWDITTEDAKQECKNTIKALVQQGLRENPAMTDDEVEAAIRGYFNSLV